MGLKSRIRALEKRAEGPLVTIPQEGGPAKRFPERMLAEAFLSAYRRGLGLGETEEEHPLCAAARNSSEYSWRVSAYVQEPADHPPEDLSEP